MNLFISLPSTDLILILDDDYGTNCVMDEVLIKVRRGQMLFFPPSNILRSLVPRKITFFNVEGF